MKDILLFILNYYVNKKHKKIDFLTEISNKIPGSSSLKLAYNEAIEREAFFYLFNIYPKNEKHQKILIDLYQKHIIFPSTEASVLYLISEKDGKAIIKEKKQSFIEKHALKILIGFPIFMMLIIGSDFLGYAINNIVINTIILLLIIFYIILFKPLLSSLFSKQQHELIQEKLEMMYEE